jgi:hypothetical protein
MNTATETKPALTAEQIRILKGLADDSGAFRVSNKQAASIAEACAAALKALGIEA